MDDNGDYARAWARSDEDLLRELGGLPFKGAIEVDRVRRGREVYSNLKRNLRRVVCGSTAVRELHARAGTTNVVLVAAVADCIAGYLTGISAATVAVLLVREGLPQVCKGEWPAP